MQVRISRQVCVNMVSLLICGGRYAGKLLNKSSVPGTSLSLEIGCICFCIEARHAMYLLTWNNIDRQIEASFGGHITQREAEVFIDELRDLVKSKGDCHFDVMVDYSTTSHMEESVAETLEQARELCLFGGASRITFLTRNQTEASVLTNSRLQGVLEGRERYLAHAA